MKDKHHASRKHGMYGTRVYWAWVHMKQRCLSEKHDYFDLYGGRGIRVCDEWLEFVNFYKDMGEPPSSVHTLDRIDNNGNYEPSNCRWATPKEQGNNRRTNVLLECEGKKMTIAQWSEHRNIPYQTIYARLNKHKWSVERALGYA